MKILYFLESIRTPVGDLFMSLTTRLGEEMIFIVLALLFLWCINKKEGYYLLTVGFFGLWFSQFLKIFCRVPRPWVKDPSFQPVESAVPGAEGYSFPSGHTQMSVGAYGALARWHRSIPIRVIGIIFCVLVPFSRMYLGVHTPLDVGVSLLFALALIFGLYPFFKNLDRKPYRLFYLIGVMALLSLSYVIYLECTKFPEGTDAENLASAVKNAYTLLGSVLGFLFVYFMDVRVHRYETRAPLLAQILKLSLGTLLVLAIRYITKEPLTVLFGGHSAAHAVRYFLMFALAGGLWPFTFPYFSRFASFLKRKMQIGAKKRKS